MSIITNNQRIKCNNLKLIQTQLDSSKEDENITEHKEKFTPKGLGAQSSHVMNPTPDLLL